MKVTLKCEGLSPLAIRVTLPQKQLHDMTGDKLLALFAKQHDRKFAAEQPDSTPFCCADHFLKIIGGNRLASTDLVADYVTDGAEVLVVHKDGPAEASAAASASTPSTRASASASPVVASKNNMTTSTAGDAANGTTTCTSADPEGAAKQARKAAEAAGKVRCKNFGCSKFFDPVTEGGPQECRHHKSPPIFHETAKWWSCCPDKKAYDWDEFQKIPGCQWGPHSTVAAKKQVLGGTDLREANAPQRIDQDGNATLEPRKKLDLLRKAMATCGVDEAKFDKAWGQLMVRHGGKLETVVDKIGAACERALVEVTEGKHEDENNYISAGGGAGSSTSPSPLVAATGNEMMTD
ncbi:unnamed protein product [Amoebophrya sp. A120]|nr:unnamed protein product [Amoebophrya sp. A120]|eukprot:GSA120T00021537001.1